MFKEGQRVRCNDNYPTNNPRYPKDNIYKVERLASWNGTEYLVVGMYIVQYLIRNGIEVNELTRWANCFSIINKIKLRRKVKNG